MSEPFRCMATGRQGYHLALKVTPTALGPFSRPILLDPGAVQGLINSAVDILEAGIDFVTEEDDES